MRKVLLSLLVVAFGATAFLTGCDDGSHPLEPPLDELQPSFDFIDGSSGGNPGVFFRAPLGSGWQRPGTFDPSVPLQIQIRQRGTSNVEVFSVEAGSVMVYPWFQMYSLWWEIPDVPPGTIFEVSVRALTLELAYADLEIAGNSRDWFRIRRAGENVGIMDFRRHVPIRLYVNTDAVPIAVEEEEEDCVSGGIIIDCDVEILDNTEGGEVEVHDETDPDAPLAARLTVDPGDVVDGEGNPVEDYILTLLHLPLDTKPSPTIPTTQQFPFIIQGTITDGQGNPLFFQEGASLVLCQPENIHLEVPEPQAAYQKIFKVDDGVTTFLDTEYGAPECDWGHHQPVAMNGSAGTKLLRLAQRSLKSIGGLFMPEPARASHGGLRSIREIGGLSHLGASLLTVPSVSTAVVPDGTVDSPTTIEIQAMIPGELVQLYGGDEVVVTVSGANSAVLTIGNEGVLDNDDGTYTATYTPQEPGEDEIEIEILDPITDQLVRIEGSPFSSNVVGGLVTPDLGFTNFDPDGGVAGYTYYFLTINNWASYPDNLFIERPDLPPCGLNTSASQTWLSIFDASTDGGLNGFCAIDNAQGLEGFWFAEFDGVAPPREVYVTLTDRGPDPDVVVQSNTVTLPLTAGGTAVIDGVKTVGEWDGAASLILSSPGSSVDGGTLYVMNDDSRLYLGFEIADATPNSLDKFEIRFDNLLDGVDTSGDDNLFLSYLAGPGDLFEDSHFNGTSWGVPDAQQDGTGDAENANGVSFFEMEHRLFPESSQDFNISEGMQLGFCLRYFQDNTATGSFPAGCMLAPNQQSLYDRIGRARPGS